MKHVEPKVFLTGHTQIKKEGMRAWLDSKGAMAYQLREVISDAENMIMVNAKRCYMSFEAGLNPNVTKVRHDAALFLKNILEVGHGSVLEHVYFTFALENVSRVFTAEMNRHRAGMAISEGSMRYIRFTDIPYWVPNSIRQDDKDPKDIQDKKTTSREIFDEVFMYMEEKYTELVDLWDMDNIPDFKTKKQLTSAFRRIIGIGVASGGVWTGNVRALRHIFEMRCSEYAEEEICLVAEEMLRLMMTECPLLFGDFYVNEKGFWGPTYRKV